MKTCESAVAGWLKDEPPSVEDATDVVFVSSSTAPASVPECWLGISAQDTSRGVEILTIDYVSPAFGTLYPGDFIVEVAGVPTEQMAVVKALIHEQTPGTVVPIAIRRNGVVLTIAVQLAGHS